MPLLGAHHSIAGGYYKAVEAAARFGMDCVQLFTKNNNQWRAKPLSDEDTQRFQQALSDTGIRSPIAHDSYLINLGSPDDELWNRSIESLAMELDRAARLGIPHVVAHPGSHVGTGEDVGLSRIAQGLDLVFDRDCSQTTIALEITAGQGTNLGYRFEHLRTIIDRCSFPDRLTVCLDTCHLFAAGYPLAPKRKYNETMKEFASTIGLERLVAFHLNDSKKGLGSRVDRHDHIGRGEMGTEPFELVLNDRRFKNLPMYLETPKGIDEQTGEEWDAINFATLCRLAGRH